MLVKLSTGLDMGLSKHLNATVMGNHVETTLFLSTCQTRGMSDVVTLFDSGHFHDNHHNFPLPMEL